jgi:hypothetical protein
MPLFPTGCGLPRRRHETAMPTTIRTDHTNELILVDELLIDPTGSAVVTLGLVNQDASDTFPGRTLTPDQAEQLAAALATSAATARASAGLAPTPLAGEQAHSETLNAIRAAVPLTNTSPPLADSPDSPDEKAHAATSPPAGATATPSRPPRPSATPRPSPQRAATGAEAAARQRPRTAKAQPHDQPRGRIATEPPIADYDQLNVTAITNRLSGLSKAQLSNVLAYEQSHRNRKTICDRIAALHA